jgi:hypothetical protein
LGDRIPRAARVADEDLLSTQWGGINYSQQGQISPLSKKARMAVKMPIGRLRGISTSASILQGGCLGAKVAVAGRQLLIASKSLQLSKV